MFGMPPPLYNQQSLATISPAMGAGGGAVTGPSKIDPNQIPRPIPSSSVLIHETRQDNQANPPPPATSEFIVRDTGNCSPRYMRCTINQVIYISSHILFFYEIHYRVLNMLVLIILYGRKESKDFWFNVDSQISCKASS